MQHLRSASCLSYSEKAEYSSQWKRVLSSLLLTVSFPEACPALKRISCFFLPYNMADEFMMERSTFSSLSVFCSFTLHPHMAATRKRLNRIPVLLISVRFILGNTLLSNQSPFPQGDHTLQEGRPNCRQSAYQ